MTSVEAGESVDECMNVKAVRNFEMDGPCCSADKETDISLLIGAAP